MRRPEHTEDRSPVELPRSLIQGGSFLTAFQAAQHISILPPLWSADENTFDEFHVTRNSCFSPFPNPVTTKCKREGKTMLSQAMPWSTEIMNYGISEWIKTSLQHSITVRARCKTKILINSIFLFERFTQIQTHREKAQIVLCKLMDFLFFLFFFLYIMKQHDINYINCTLSSVYCFNFILYCQTILLLFFWLWYHLIKLDTVEHPLPPSVQWLLTVELYDTLNREKAL